MSGLKINGLRWWMIGLLMLGSIINYLTRSTLAVAAPTLMKQLSVTAQVGSRCVIRASDDLSSWLSLATNVVPSSGVWNFTDTNLNAHFHRFYRAASEQ